MVGKRKSLSGVHQPVSPDSKASQDSPKVWTIDKIWSHVLKTGKSIYDPYWLKKENCPWAN